VCPRGHVRSRPARRRAPPPRAPHTRRPPVAFCSPRRQGRRRQELRSQQPPEFVDLLSFWFNAKACSPRPNPAACSSSRPSRCRTSLLYLRPYAARPYACETQFPCNIISLAPKLNDFFSSNCYVAPVLLVDVKHWMDVVVWCCNENDHPKISRWCLIYFVFCQS
jgi:hypothetical protein